jgi:hypothetical protein
MKKTDRKMTLSRHTVRTLTERGLETVAAGVVPGAPSNPTIEPQFGGQPQCNPPMPQIKIKLM